MAKMKTMWIAMANGGLLAAAAMGLSEDRAVDPHAPVEVPEEYGRHLIHDKFAYVAEPPADVTPEPSKKPASSDKGGKGQKPATSDPSSSASTGEPDPAVVGQGGPEGQGSPDASGAGQA